MSSSQRNEDPVFSFGVPTTLPGPEYTVDANTFIAKPLLGNEKMYGELGDSVASLTLSGASEKDLKTAFAIFKRLRKLTLNNMNILSTDPTGYPTSLEILSFNNSLLPFSLLEKWFKQIDESGTLNYIHVNRSYYNLKVPQNHDISDCIQFLQYVPNVCIDNSIHFGGFEAVTTIRRMKITSDDDIDNENYYLGGEFILLEYLHFESRVGDYGLDYLVSKSLKTLVLGHCPENVALLTKFKSLEHVKILRSVHPEVKAKLLLMNFTTLEVDVDYWMPPETPNSIFMLDDDSFINILSRLSQPEWISLMKIHPRFDYLIRHHILTKFKITIYSDRFLEQHPLNENEDLMAAIGSHTRSLDLYGSDDLSKILAYFGNLRKLNITSLEDLNSIPDGLNELEIICDDENQSFANLFRRLDKTLSSLKIEGTFELDDLNELHHIRSLELEISFDLLDIDEESYISPDISGFLENNKDHLESLKIRFFGDFDMRSIREAIKEPYNLLSPPPKQLKVLHMEDLTKRIPMNPVNFQKLEEIRLLWCEEFFPLVRILSSEFWSFKSQIKTLIINGKADYNLIPNRLPGLVSLEIEDDLPNEEDVLSLILRLPNLRRFGCLNGRYSLEFFVELRKFLSLNNRSLDLFLMSDRGDMEWSVKIPG